MALLTMKQLRNLFLFPLKLPTSMMSITKGTNYVHCDGLLIQMKGNARNPEGTSKRKTVILIVLKHPNTSYMYKCNT